jgi:hypothetical protein
MAYESAWLDSGTFTCLGEQQPYEKLPGKFPYRDSVIRLPSAACLRVNGHRASPRTAAHVR